MDILKPPDIFYGFRLSPRNLNVLTLEEVVLDTIISPPVDRNIAHRLRDEEVFVKTCVPSANPQEWVSAIRIPHDHSRLIKEGGKLSTVVAIEISRQVYHVICHRFLDVPRDWGHVGYSFEVESIDRDYFAPSGEDYSAKLTTRAKLFEPKVGHKSISLDYCISRGSRNLLKGNITTAALERGKYNRIMPRLTCQVSTPPRRAPEPMGLRRELVPSRWDAPDAFLYSTPTSHVVGNALVESFFEEFASFGIQDKYFSISFLRYASRYEVITLDTQYNETERRCEGIFYQNGETIATVRVLI